MGRVFYRSNSLEPLTNSSITVQHMMRSRGSQPRQRIDRFVPRCCRKRRQAIGDISYDSNTVAGQTTSNCGFQTPKRHSARHSKNVAGAGAVLVLTSSGVGGGRAAHCERDEGESHVSAYTLDDECSDDSSDSETETSPGWLRQFVCAQIDDFTDLNPGEKRLMTLWNMHQLRHMFLYSRLWFTKLFISSDDLNYRIRFRQVSACV